MLLDVPVVFAFSAGLVAAFNPCGAAMFPAYVGYQLNTFQHNPNPIISGFKSILLGLSATSGFVVIFGGVGIVLAAGGRVIGKFLPFAGLAVGVIILTVGLWLLISRRKIGIMATSRVSLGGGRGIRHCFLFGIAYAVASLSCALPIFLAAVGIVAGQSLNVDNAARTMIGSIAYGLGMGVVLILASLGVVFFKELVAKTMRFAFRIIEPMGNLAMVVAGSYLIHYWTFGEGRELLVIRAQQLGLSLDIILPIRM